MPGIELGAMDIAVKKAELSHVTCSRVNSLFLR